MAFDGFDWRGLPLLKDLADHPNGPAAGEVLSFGLGGAYAFARNVGRSLGVVHFRDHKSRVIDGDEPIIVATSFNLYATVEGYVPSYATHIAAVLSFIPLALGSVDSLVATARLRTIDSGGSDVDVGTGIETPVEQIFSRQEGGAFVNVVQVAAEVELDSTSLGDDVVVESDLYLTTSEESGSRTASSARPVAMSCWWEARD